MHVFCSTAAGFLFRRAIEGALRNFDIASSTPLPVVDRRSASLILKMDEVILVQVHRESYLSNILTKATGNRFLV